MSGYHQPVMLQEAVAGLAIQKEGVYVDATFGGGGHSRAILAQLTNGKLLAFDQDEDAKANLWIDERLEFVGKNFAFLEETLAARDLVGVDGILADLGISSHQIDTAERGFSYRFDAPLDMRMDANQSLTAATVLNTYEGEDLIRMFRQYGEVNNAPKLVRVIVQRRSGEEIRFTQQFARMIEGCIPPKRSAKYLAQVFQALRIEVNGELRVLERLLISALHCLKPGGRLVVIAYHSLEDRMVKHFMRAGNFTGQVLRDEVYGQPLTPWKLITRKALMPNEAEIAANPRARSARLRIAERNDLIWNISPHNAS